MNDRKVASCGELRNTVLAAMRSTCARTAAAFGWFSGFGAEVIGSTRPRLISRACRQGCPNVPTLVPRYSAAAQNHRVIVVFSPRRDQTTRRVHAFSPTAAAPPLMPAWRLRMCGVWTDLKHETDVAVIGAGAAGIAAARRLTDAGVACVLIEARNRVGGRAHTLPGEFALDIGCGWPSG